jgi:hypothetical protein
MILSMIPRNLTVTNTYYTIKSLGLDIFDPESTGI